MANNNSVAIALQMRAQRLAQAAMQVANAARTAATQAETKADSVAQTPGQKGDPGDKGDPGKQGIQGIQGIQGERGLQGISGTNGTNGTNGLVSNGIATAAFTLPVLSLGAVTTLTATLSHTMPNAAYNVEVPPAPGLTYVVTNKTTTSVTIKFTAALAISLGAPFTVTVWN